jgi:hypothetical protein
LIVASHRNSAILVVLQEAEVGNDAMVALLDPVRAHRGPLILAPNTNIAASAMIKVMLPEPPGYWLLSRRPDCTPAAAFAAAT